MIQLIHGDCLEKLKEITSGSVDMVLADLPYGTTACKWDTRLLICAPISFAAFQKRFPRRTTECTVCAQ